MIVHRSFALGIAGALAALGVLLMTDRANAEGLTGHVQSVDPVAGAFVVKETETGRDVTVAVNGQTMITTAAGVPVALKDLKKGDGVGITHGAGVASRILVNSKPPELAGQISSIDLDARQLVVTQAETDKEFPVATDARTRIVTLGGESLALKDLKQGDGVGISYEGNIARLMVVNVKPDELDGHVKSVGADLKSFVVTETGTHKDVSVVVNADTRIMTSEGKKLEMKDMKKGDGVGIAHRASVASKVVVNVRPLQ
jgi:hypothetical protein